MSDYPFLSRIRERLALKQNSLEWLAGQMDRSLRWVQGLKDPSYLSVIELNRLSQLLEFNFMDDYNHWLVSEHKDPLYILNEPQGEYLLSLRRVAVRLDISGSVQAAEQNMGKMLREIRKVGEEFGFSIDEKIQF